MCTAWIVVISLSTWAVLRGIEILGRHLFRRRKDKRAYRLWRARRQVALTALEDDAARSAPEGSGKSV